MCTLVSTLSSVAAMFVAPSAACDECGWRRVQEIPVLPAVVFEEDELPARSFPAPGVVDMDLGLVNHLPSGTLERIRELAKGLDYDPEKCYRYVRDNIAYVSYFGILKGPERTLLDRGGNELDQAFLLLALLRASGFQDAGIGYSPLVYTNGVPSSCFRVPLRRHESGSDYNAADWMGVNGTGSITDVVVRVRTMHALAGHQSDIVTESGVPYLLTDHFYVTLPAEGGGTYLMDPAFKPSESHQPVDFVADSGYSRSDLLSAVGGVVTTSYVKDLSKSGLRAYLDGRMAALRGVWTNANTSASHFVGGSIVVPQSVEDDLYFHGAKIGSRRDFLVQPDVDKNAFRAKATLKIGESVLYEFFLDEIGVRELWMSFMGSSTDNPMAILHLDDSILTIGSAGSASNTVPFTVLVSYAMGSNSHTYNLRMGAFNAYAIAIGLGGDSLHGIRKVATEELDKRIAGGDVSSVGTRARSLWVAGHQWIAQVAMMSRLRSRMCDYSMFDYYNVGIVGYDGSTYLDFGSRFGYFSNLTDEMEGLAFFDSALEHAVLDQLNGVSMPSVSTVRVIDAANAEGMRIYFATSNHYAAAISALTNYDYAVKADIRRRVRSGCSALLPKSGKVAVNGWTGYGYAIQDHVNNVAGMFVEGGRNGGYCTVNAPPAVVEYVERTSTVSTSDASIVQPVSADPVAMPSGAYCDASTDISVLGGTSLDWTRYYDSRSRWRSGDLGFGWCHGFEASVVEVSDPDAFFGCGSVDATLPTIIAHMVINDMMNGEWGACAPGLMARRWTLAAMVAQWWTERTTGTSVIVTLGSRSLRFWRREDGTYTPSPGVTATLVRMSDGRYVLSERHGNTYVFNGAGRLSTISDISGNITALTYQSGRLTQIDNAFGASLSFDWHNGRISRVVDSAGRFVTYSYDSSGRLSTVNDVRGMPVTFTYDPETSALVTKTDPFGRVLVRNVYNVMGQVTNQVSDAGGAWTFGYCGDVGSWDDAPDGGRRLRMFDMDGRMVYDRTRTGGWTRLSYDGHGHITCSLSKFGRVDTHTYGENDLPLVSGINVEGHVTTYSYDAQLRVSEITNAVGGETRFTYDNCHRVTFIVRPDGSAVSNEWTSTGLLSVQTILSADGSVARKTTWEYDTSGLPMSMTVFGTGLPSEGVSESYAYDSARRMVSRTDANGHTTLFSYDSAGNMLSRVAPDGAMSSFVYDDAGRQVSASDALGRTSVYTWTPSGKLSSTIRPDGSVMTNVYDESDRLTAATDAHGATVSFEYDVDGRVVRRTGPADMSSFAYNAAGFQCAMTNAVGGVTFTGYDFANNPIVSSNTDGRVRWTAYDGFDRAVATSNSIGRAKRFSYDPKGRKVVEFRPSGVKESFAYDVFGNCISSTNAEGHSYMVCYDALGRVMSATNALGQCVFIAEYDGVGNVTSRTDGAGHVVMFAYDSCDRLVTRVTAEETADFSYNIVGNLLSASNTVAMETFDYDLCDRLSNAVTQIGTNAWQFSWSYDAGGLATNVVYSPGKSIRRVYDEAGRLVSVTDWLGHTWTFSWNGLGQQMGGTSPGGIAHAFTYDVYGNMTAWSVNGIAGRTIHRDTEGRRLKDSLTAGQMPMVAHRRNAENRFDEADRLVAATVAYNGSRHPVKETYIYDDCGAMTNATSNGETVFAAEYNTQGRIAAMGCQSASLSTFSYDALGNRIIVANHIFIPDHSDPLKRPLIECDINGTPLRYYIWGLGRLLGFIADSTLTVVHSDEQGSVIALTDEDGDVLCRANYSPYGEDWGCGGMNVTPFSWLGGLGVMRMDMSSFMSSAFEQTYLMRHRLYSPVLRRFLSADPLGLAGGLNLYAYSNGNPLSYVDPIGLCASSCDVWTRIGGFFQMIGGSAEAVIGYGFAAFAAETGVGIAAGMLVGLHGSDVALSGFNTMRFGVPQDSMASQVFQSAGVPQDLANGIDAGISMVGTIGAGSAARGSMAAFDNVFSASRQMAKDSCPMSIQFGGNANQTYHALRHVDEMGLSRTMVQRAVSDNIREMSCQIVPGKPFVQTITVGGQKLQYNAYLLPNGVINVGRINGIP